VQFLFRKENGFFLPNILQFISLANFSVANKADPKMQLSNGAFQKESLFYFL
jgi:hypothetical protein